MERYLEEVGTNPDGILLWHWQLLATKWDSKKQVELRFSAEQVELVRRMAGGFMSETRLTHVAR